MSANEWMRRVEQLLSETFNCRIGIEEITAYHFRVIVLVKDDARDNFSFDVYQNGTGNVRLGDWRPSGESPDIKDAVERIFEELRLRGRVFQANETTEKQLVKLKAFLSTRQVTMVPSQFDEYRFRLYVEHASLGRGSGSVYFRKSGLNSDTWSNETCNSDLSDIIKTALLQVAPPQRSE